MSFTLKGRNYYITQNKKHREPTFKWCPWSDPKIKIKKGLNKILHTTSAEDLPDCKYKVQDGIWNESYYPYRIIINLYPIQELFK